MAKPQDRETLQKNAQLVLQNWNEAIWRETVLLYTAQLTPGLLNQVIRKALEQGNEAAELAAVALQEYPRLNKLSDKLMGIMQKLSNMAQYAKYLKLEELLKSQKWQEADEETYRLMIITIGKEEGQWFERQDLENFPCEDLRTLDQLWVKCSNGKFGFGIQKRIWKECGSPTTSGVKWEEFCGKLGWKDPDFLDVVTHSGGRQRVFPTEVSGLHPNFKRFRPWSLVLSQLFSRLETCKL